MNELLKLIRKSKTAKAGIVTALLAILLLSGTTNTPAPESIDEMQLPQSNRTLQIVGALALLAGIVTLKGRVDIERKVKGLEDEKAK